MKPTQAEQLIRFYGLEASLEKWRGVVGSDTGRAGGPIVARKMATGVVSHSFQVLLDPSDRERLMRRWYESSGTGFTATNRPYRWNDCISFAEVKTKKARAA